MEICAKICLCVPGLPPDMSSPTDEPPDVGQGCPPTSTASHSLPPPRPGFPGPPPNFSQPPPIFNQPPTNFSQPPLNFNQPPPNFSQPPPNFNQPPPNFNQPPLNYNQSPLNFNQPPLNYSQPPPNFSQPPPSFSQPPLNFDQPPPNFSQPPLNFNQPPLNFNQPPLNFNQPPPTALASGPLPRLCLNYPGVPPRRFIGPGVHAPRMMGRPSARAYPDYLGVLSPRFIGLHPSRLPPPPPGLSEPPTRSYPVYPGSQPLRFIAPQPPSVPMPEGPSTIRYHSYPEGSLPTPMVRPPGMTSRVAMLQPPYAAAVPQVRYMHTVQYIE